MSTEPLTLAESSRLMQLETIIKRGIEEVGEALMDIRDSRLYKAEHGTFEAYCKEKWGYTRQHANRLIGASVTVAILEPTGSIVPESERQIRPLTSLPPEQQTEVWSAAVESANGQQPTTRQVEEAKRKISEVGIKLTPTTVESLAAQYGVSVSTLKRDGKKAEQLEKLFKAAPDLARKVVIGEMKLSKAIKEATEPKQRGSFADWQQFRTLCEEATVIAEKLTTLTVDAPHQIKARDLADAVARKFSAISNKQ